MSSCCTKNYAKISRLWLLMMIYFGPYPTSYHWGGVYDLYYSPSNRGQSRCFSFTFLCCIVNLSIQSMFPPSRHENGTSWLSNYPFDPVLKQRYVPGVRRMTERMTRDITARITTMAIPMPFQFRGGPSELPRSWFEKKETQPRMQSWLRTLVLLVP